MIDATPDSTVRPPSWTSPTIWDSHPGDPSRKVTAPRWSTLVSFIVVQAVVAMIINFYPSLAILQAAGIAVFGMWAAGRRNLAMILSLIAYLPGAEMLWRQSHSPIYYLTAPYITIVLAVFATTVVLGRVNSAGRMAILYMAVLLPSIAVTIKTAGPGSREIVSFALTGPIAFGTLVLFTSQVKVQRWLYLRLLWIVLISSVAPLTIAIYAIKDGLGTLTFTDQSNFVTSGGTAPVQVSALLGLAVLAGILIILHEKDRMVRLIAIVLTVIFMVQCFLTFSRGGMTAVVISMIFLAVLQANDTRLRNRIILISGIALALCWTVVFPWLDDFTKGAFQKRFSSSKTGRTQLASNDISIFLKHPLFGVGPGMTKYQRLGYDVCQIRSDHCNTDGSSHTEWTRMLSEHGVAGVIATIVLIALILRALKQSDSATRPFTIALLTWGVAQMFYANFRIVAVPFALALAFVRVSEPTKPGSANDEDIGERRPLWDQSPAPPTPALSTLGTGPTNGTPLPNFLPVTNGMNGSSGSNGTNGSTPGINDANGWHE